MAATTRSSFLDNFDSSSQIIDGGTGTNTLSLDGD